MKLHRILSGLLVAAVLPACSVMPMQGHKTRITSTPSGADVYSGQLKLGQTPLEIDPNEAFPPAWQNKTYQAAGVLIVRKPGCQEYNHKVSDAFLAKDIHVKLKCDPNYQPARAPASPAAPATAPRPAPAPRADIATRLQKLKSLYEKGLITQDEYKATRRRILDEL